jgi:hypothetical protein
MWFVAPYRQRDEARQKINEIEASIKQEIFEVEWPHKSMNLLVAKGEDGQWVAGAGAIGPAPITIVNRKELLSITQLQLAPEVHFEHKTGWGSTNAITVTPLRLVLPSTQITTIGIEWDTNNQTLWELKGLPFTIAKDGEIKLPQMMLQVTDASEVGKHFDAGEQCSLVIRLIIRTDKGAQDIPDISIELNPSDGISWMVDDEKKTNG